MSNDEKIAGGQRPPDRRLLTAGYSLIRDRSDFVIRHWEFVILVQKILSSWMILKSKL